MTFQVEKILMPVLEENGAYDMLFNKTERPARFHEEVTNYFNRKLTEIYWQGRAYHLATSFV
jgi:hypothetical protein